MDYRLTLLLVLAAGAHAGPAGRGALKASSPATSSCSTICTTRNKFSYTPGNTYDFKYEVETKTSMLGASEDQSIIEITAIASIEVHSKCEMILNVNNVNIYAHDSRQFKDEDVNGQFSSALERHPLRFSFQDGEIDATCPDADEPTWALNVKKGILSTFQNTMVNFANDHSGIESDVSGKCKTAYKVTSEGWRTVALKKSKTMDDCTHRHDYESAIQTIPFRISSGLKSLPILKSTHECDQEINKAQGTLASTLCHEMHVLRPFSNQLNGATTETTQKLTFVQQKQSLENAHIEAGASQALHFEHTQQPEMTDLTAREALDLLRDVCKSTKKEVSPDTPEKFATLVSTMKRIDYSGLRRVYNQVHKTYFCKANPEVVRKFAIDAIPMVGTEASVELMKTLMSNKDETGDTLQMWLESLAFIQKPSVKMIQQIAQLTGLPWMSTKVLLPLSGLVHSYCRTNPQCESVKEVKAVIDEIERNIQGGCKVTQANFRMTMMSLRAIGNIGHAETSMPALESCMMEKENPTDIRIAAIDAFRRLSCATDRNNMMALYRNIDEDAELRIAAYLGVMRCPTPYIIAQVKQTLAEEQVNQVGSFVWSHITNLMESTDPANKPVQQLLNDEAPEKEFDLDRTKFSRNYEGSFFLESLNAGAKVDSNLIWSTKSFVPRSGYFNLTTNVFGESLNLFELGGRVEGLDRTLESYFGPKGYFNREGENEAGNEVPEADPKLARLSDSKFNSIRSKAKKTGDELRGAMFIRMFGTEMSYSMFGANNGVNEDIKSSQPDMLDFLNKWRNNKYQDIFLTRSFMFLDSTYTVPTIAGLPMKLSVNGTATVALTAGGQMDMKKPGSKVLLEANLQPSGTVEIDSVMSVDAFVTRGGLKMTSSLHTSTGAKAKVEVTDGSAVDVTFDMTKEKQEIVNVKNSFFIMYKDVEKEQKMIVKNRLDKTMCTGNKVEKITGVEFCTSFSVPNATFKADAPNFPFSGPAEASVTVDRKDLPNGYKFEAKVIKTPVLTLLRLKSDTPGSNADRAIGLDVNVVHKEKTLEVNFQSPWKVATLTGQMTVTPDVKGLIGKLNVDNGARLYNLDAKVQVEEIGDRLTYTPTVTLEIPDWAQEKIQLTGMAKVVKMKSLNSDLTITGATKEPIAVQAKVMNTDTQVGTQLKFNYQTGAGYIVDAMVAKDSVTKKKTTVRLYTPRLYIRSPDKVLVEADGKAEYTEDKSLKIDGKIQNALTDNIIMKADVSKSDISKKKKRIKYSAQMKVECGGKSTKVMFVIDNRQDKNIFNRLRFDYNLAKGIRDTLILQNRLKMNLGKTKNVVKLTSNLNSLKNNNLDGQLSVNYAKTRFVTNFAADVKYGKNMKSKSSKEKIDLNFQAKHKLSGSKKTVNYTMDFNFPAKDIELILKGGHVQAGQVIHEDVEFQYHPERSVSFNLRMHNKTSKYPNYAGEIGIGLPEGRAMSFAGAFGRETEDKYISSLEFEIIKGRRTRVDSMLKISSESLYEVEVGVQLPDLDPVRVFGGYNKLKKGYKASAWFQRGDKRYSVASEGELDWGKRSTFLADVTVPSRRVKLLLQDFMSNTERNALLDIQWNADENLDDRVLFNITSDWKGSDDFEVALLMHYPGRTVDFSMKHSSSSRYITNVRLSWSPTEKIELDLIFRNDELDSQKRTELSVMFSSPFEPYEELGVAVSLFRDSSQYQTKSSLTWAKNQKVLVSATAKMPMSVNSVDIVGTVTTPFKRVRSMTAQVKHRYNKDLKSSALFEWGANRLSVSMGGNAKVTALGFESFDGNMDIRTPWEGMRIFLISAEFTNNKQNKITSRLSLDLSRYSGQKNLEKYLIEMDMLYSRLPDTLTNEGNLRITIPNDDIRTDWEVTLKRNLQHVMLHIQPQRGNNFKVQLNNHWDITQISYKYGTSFQLVMPLQSFKQLDMEFEFEARDKFVEVSTLMQKDTIPIFSHKFKYQLGPGNLQLTSSINYVSVDEVNIKLVSSHSLMPYRARLECQWAPNQQITASSNIIYNEFGMYDMGLNIQTPFPRYRNLVMSSTRKRVGFNWEASSEIEYAPQQKIQLETIYRYDHVKVGSISLKTPFPQFPGLDTSVRVDGGVYNFKGDASFSMAPYVNKISSDFSWAYYRGTSLAGVFNLKTPFRQYPYMNAKVESNILGVSRVSKVEVEYLPTQVVKVEADYRFTSIETLEGNVKVTSPYTDNQQVVAGFTHNGNREEFSTNARITCKCFPRPVFAKTTYSSKNGILSTFEMDSHFRGYQTVKWNFNHQGTIRDFRTIAEYETNGKKITLNNVVNVKNKVQVQSTLLTPFPEMSKAHVKLLHNGVMFNTDTTIEAALNDKLIKAGAEMTNNKKASSAKVLISTPFKPLENLDISITRKGSLADLELTGNVEYEQRWHGNLKHKADTTEVHSSLNIETPINNGYNIDASMDYEGVPTNFKTSSAISVGPNYKTQSTTVFVFDQNNVTASVETVTEIGEDVQRSKFSLEHGQMIVLEKDSLLIDISTQAYVKIQKDQEAKLNFGFYSKPYMLKIKTFAVLELPIQDYEISQLFLEYEKDIIPEVQVKEFQKIVLDIPILEKFEQMSNSVTTYPFRLESSRTTKYGKDVITEEQLLTMGKYMYKMTSPYEGFKAMEFDVNYKLNDHNADTGDLGFEMDGKLSHSSLPSDIKAAASYSLKNAATTKMNTQMSGSITYDTDQTVALSQEYKPGMYNVKFSSPYQGYENLELNVNHEGLMGGNMLVTCSGWETPIQSSYSVEYTDAANMELSYKFTSGFPNFTHFKAELRSSKTGSTYKPYTLLGWEDENQQLQEIEADGEIKVSYLEFKDMSAGFTFTLRSPFTSLEDMKLQYDHTHYVSPMRAKEIVYIRFNRKTYLDMEAEVGALNKFTGSIIFREPRQMEFSFSGLNEGESVDIDLHINWNKLERKSRFRLQFGLADNSNKLVSKKVFHMKITSPNRIVSLNNNLEMKDFESVSSDGQISWDAENGKGATYKFVFTNNNLDIDSSLEIVVPTRTVKISGSTNALGAKKMASMSVMWDAERDTDKMVKTTVTISTPDTPRKAFSVAVKVPGIQKELTLKSELTVSPTSLDIAGKTEFSYSADEDKTLRVTYSLTNESNSATTIATRAQWKLQHIETGTDLDLTNVITCSTSMCDLKSVLKYATSARDIAQHTVNVAINRDDRLVTIAEHMFRGMIALLSFLLELTKNGKNADLQMICPNDKALMTGQLTAESPYTLTVDLQRNSRPMWNTVWSVDTLERTLDATMTYGDKQREISTRAFFPNDTSFESETMSESAMGMLQEGFMTANLNDRVLHGHLKWRPEIVKDVMNFGADCLMNLGTEMNRILQDSSSGFGSEVVTKYRGITGSLVQEMAPLSDSMAEEVREFQKDLRDMRRALKKMVKNNELYLGTLEEMCSGAINNIIEGYTVTIQKVGQGYLRLQESIEELSNKIDQYPLQEKYAAMKQTVNNMIQESRVVIETEIKLLLKEITEFMASLDKTMNDALAELEQYAMAMVDEFALTPFLEELKAKYDQLIQQYPDLSDLKIHKLLSRIHKLLVDAMEQSSLTEKYRVISKSAKQIMKEEFGDMLENEDIRDLYMLMQEIYEQVTWLYQYTDIDTTDLRALVDKIIASTRTRLMAEFNQLPIGILDMHKSKFTTFDLEKGEIEFDLYLPIPMRDFKELLRFSVKKYVAKLKKMADKYFPRRDICLWDIYYRIPVVQWSVREDLLPPFDAFATVSGSQHYRTFDGRHLNLAGMCSYVLVEDLADGNFSIVQRYTGGPKNRKREALIVMVAGDTIEIMDDYMVKVNGQPRELPYEKPSLSVIRQSNRILLGSDIGLDIISDMSNDFHIIGLSGWYHGKVAGLLGTYDNEPYNDMMVPGGELETGEQKFINQWEVDKSCSSRQMYVTEPSKGQKSEECAAVFDKSSSALRACFLQVEPSEYQNQCDMTPDAICDIAALYKHTCAKHGVTVDLPETCLMCDASGLKLSGVETVKFERGSRGTTGLRQSMDVVFVVEEGSCNRDLASRLDNIVYQMDQSMQKAGSTDSRYALVGYRDGKISSHTMEGQLFNEASSVGKGLENLRFTHTAGLASSPLDAVMYATKLPYRPGVTKTIVLMSCSGCQGTDSLTHTRLATALRQRDITLHILRENSFLLKNNRVPDSQVYGIDNSQAYLHKPETSKRDLFPEILPPQDACADLAMRSNGSLFDAVHVTTGRVRQQRAFLGQLGERVASTEAASQCQSCSCELDETGSPYTVCWSCDVVVNKAEYVRDMMKYAVEYKNGLTDFVQTLLA